MQSEANAHSFYGSKDPFDAERFNGRLADADPNVKYMRTGDLGFLHNVSRPIGPGGSHVEMQILFVLGSIGETFDVHGLNHFPMDIELSVERCHRNIVPGGAYVFPILSIGIKANLIIHSAVFQAGGLVVVLVEIFRKNFLASIVPVIVNAILNHHHLVADIVAFVARGDFPRSRLGEKQRGKILASWVTRKLRTIAQFGIRDPEGGFGISDIPEETKNGTGISSGRREVSMTSSQQHNSMLAARNSQTRSQTMGQEYSELAGGDRYTGSIPELPADSEDEAGPDLDEMPDFDRNDDTPTAERPGAASASAAWSNHSRQISHELNAALDYSPIDQKGPFSDDTPLEQYGSEDPMYNVEDIPRPLQPTAPPRQLQVANVGNGDADPPSPSWKKKPFPTHEAEGKEVYTPMTASAGGQHMRPTPDYDGSGFGPSGHSRGPSMDADDEWRKNAGMYMNFTGSGPGSLEYGR